MAKVLSSISGNLISAASAGYAPTNSGDVSAIASSYQVVSATGTQLYGGTAHVTSINSAPLSASRAGNAANASMANSAYYDGTGRLISALPDSAAVSSIASSYAPTFGLNAGKISSINGSALDTPTGGGVVTATGSAWCNGNICVSSVNGSGLMAQSATQAAEDSFGYNIQAYYAKYSSLTGVSSTVANNSASWGQGGTVTSPSGTIVVMNGSEIEGTNSAVLTASGTGFESVLYTQNQQIATYMQILTDGMVPDTGATLMIPLREAAWADIRVILSGMGTGYGYESSTGIITSGALSANIPMNGIVSNISASADNWVNMPNAPLTAKKEGGIQVTGVAELAWKSAVDDVTNTVSSNSASWGGGGGVDSATVSAIASSYAESAVSGVEGTVSSNSASWGAGASLPISGVSGVDSAYYGYKGVDVSGYDTAASTTCRTQYGPYGVRAFDLLGDKSGFLTPSSLELKNENGVNAYTAAKLTRRSLTFSTQDGSSVVNATSIDRWNTISSLPGSAAVSAIASSYAESAVSSKADSSALSSFYTTANESGYVGSAYVDSAVSGKMDTFSAGEGLEFVQSGSDQVLQVEAPVDIVAGPGIVIDNPDGNTLRVSVAQAEEVVLWESNVSNGETSATLSESILNFEHVRIYYRAGERYGAWLSVDIMNRALTTNGIQLTDWFINSVDTAIIVAFAKYSVSNDGLTLTGSQLHHLWFALSNFAYSGQGTAGVYIKKVVGIHRIANN